MAVRKRDTPASQVAPKVTPVEPAADAPVPARKPFLSEGMRIDLEQYGKARDPISGALFLRDPETGAVTIEGDK